MASNYPGSLDSFDTIASDKKTSDSVGGRTHRQMHNDLGDAIEAVQGELGTTPSGSESTVAARLDKIEDGTRLAANSVGATQLADSAVDTAAIADGAVTPVKMATSGRFTFPTGAANGYGFTSGAVHLSGTGTPEGVVTAAPGSTWLQTDSTTDVKGWIRWVKATGTGNTGWVAGPEADTGWRDVTSANAAKFQAWSALRIRRVGSQVFFLVRATVGSGTASGTSSPFTLLTLPSGFQPTEYVTWGRATVAAASGAPAKIADLNTASSLGSLDLSSPSSGNWTDSVAGAATWSTTDAWPSSLPGSAA